MDDNLLEDPIALFEAQEQAKKQSVENDRRFHSLTRSLFNTKKGKEWLVQFMGRINFMGAVFDAADGMNIQHAATRDGMRSVVSEILNACHAGKSTNHEEPETDDDHE